jgi:hypothetical protein
MSHKFFNDEIGWYILIKVASGSGQVSTERFNPDIVQSRTGSATLEGRVRRGEKGQ